jgi:hypothetical protein
MTNSPRQISHPDSDEHKGAVEDDSPHLIGEHPAGNNSLRGQLGHRNLDEITDGQDTDFPEPGETPEHSGQHE